MTTKLNALTILALIYATIAIITMAIAVVQIAHFIFGVPFKVE